MADKISWFEIEEEYSSLFIDNDRGGRPAIPVRLVVGLLLLQYLNNLSGEAVCEGWVENPYRQYFCSYDFLQWELPVNLSFLSRWGYRLGKERPEQILKLIVEAGIDTGTVSKRISKKR